MNLEKVAFVSEGIKAMAVESQIEVSYTKTKQFKDRKEAIKWCQE